MLPNFPLISIAHVREERGARSTAHENAAVADEPFAPKAHVMGLGVLFGRTQLTPPVAGLEPRWRGQGWGQGQRKKLRTWGVAH